MNGLFRVSAWQFNVELPKKVDQTGLFFAEFLLTRLTAESLTALCELDSRVLRFAVLLFESLRKLDEPILGGV